MSKDPDFYIYNNDETVVMWTNRDPTPDDTPEKETMWVSTEYLPHRVFFGKGGIWMFKGKFFPKE